MAGTPTNYVRAARVTLRFPCRPIASRVLGQQNRGLPFRMCHDGHKFARARNKGVPSDALH
jgi:hypothetical protein